MIKAEHKNLLAHILECGVDDIDFIIELLVSFEIDYLDMDWSGKGANDIIYEIYDTAIDNSDIDRDEHEVYIDANYMASSLSIDGKEVSSFEELNDIGVKEDKTEEEDKEIEPYEEKKRFTGKNKRKYL